MTNTLARFSSTVAALWALGLGSGSRAAEPVRRVAKQRLPVSNLPVPRGFRTVKDESEDACAGRRRPYLCRDHKPQYQWQGVNSVHVAGTHSMVFQKGEESCTVAISLFKFGWNSGIRVQMIIMPEERGAQADTRGR